METFRALSGWVMFLIMAVMAAFFWHQSDTRGKRIEELTTRIAEIDAQIDRLTGDIISLREHMAETQPLPAIGPPDRQDGTEGEFPAAPAPMETAAP